ncbi:MAG: hypothetical protein ACE37F_15275 [Nannocystaceae bacterium]|nr:hypothetical protein [bacterium]
METFVALLSHDAAQASRALDRATSALQGLFRHVYGAQRFAFERHGCGTLALLLVRHASASMRSAVSAVATEDRLCCVYGDDPPALLEALAEGPACARASDLSFGALSFERAAATLTAVGDVTGQRSLRFAHADRVAIVSPHDVGILATGLVDFELDTASAASAFAVGWSMMGTPLARGLQRVEPMQRAVITTGGVQTTRLPALGLATEPGRRLEAAVVDAQLAYLDAALPGEGTIRVELSAGLDSRGSFASALAVRPRGQLEVFSDGGPQSQDVRVAREIAARVGVAFDNPTPVRPSHDAVVRELSHLAMAGNGTGEALAFMTNRPTDFARDPAVSVSGDGGEIFSGYYFPYRPFRAPSDAVDPAAAFRAKFRMSGVGWAAPEVGAALEQRLDTLLAEIAADARGPLDTLDRLYLFERYGVWNTKLKRCHGNASRFTPYASVRGIRAAYAGSAADKRRCNPQYSLLRTHLPQALSLPINGVRRPDLDGMGTLGRLAGDGYELGAKAARKLWHKATRALPRLGGGAGESLHRVRARVLLTLLEGGFEDSLRASSSPAARVLGERELGRALAALRGGDDGQANMLAMALMMTLYVSLCSEVAQADGRFVD